MSKDILDKLHANNLKPIDPQDTIKELIGKLNYNFSCITETGIFNIEEDITENPHDFLCDALLIKPHQPIHRRKKILEPLENRKDISWLSNVDYLFGDVAIIEQKRTDDTTTNRVFMYTITKDKNTGYTTLDYETEITGPVGKSGEIYLDEDSQKIFENIHFNKLNVDRLSVSSIYFSDNGIFSTPEIVTNKLTIGNLIFYSNEGHSELGTNDLKVNTIYGFNGPTDTIKFGSPIMIDFISSNNGSSILFENDIKVDKISTFNNNVPLIIGSDIKSESSVLNIQSPINVDKISSYTTNGNIILNSPIKVDTISSNIYDKISFNNPIVVENISSPKNLLYINSNITTNLDKISFLSPVEFNNEITIDDSKLKFKNYQYSDKFNDAGKMFIAFSTIFNITIPKLSSYIDFTKFGTPYSFVPANGEYYIAEVKNDTNTWYMLLNYNNDELNDEIRILTNRTTLDIADYENEHVFNLISSNEVYKNIFNYISEEYIPNTNKKYLTIGLTDNISHETLLNCDITLKRIPKFSNEYNIDSMTAIYFISLY